MMETLVRIKLEFPEDLADTDEQQELYNAEGARAKVLAECGILRRLWRIPGQMENIGLYETVTITQLHEVIQSWPMYRYFAEIQVWPTTNNPKDPARSPDRDSFSQVPDFDRAMADSTARKPIIGQ